MLFFIKRANFIQASPIIMYLEKKFLSTQDYPQALIIPPMIIAEIVQ